MAAQNQPQATPQGSAPRQAAPQGATQAEGRASKQRETAPQGAAKLGQRVQQAYQAYTEEVNQAWAPDDVEKRVAAEQQRYLSALQDLQTGDLRQRVEDAQRELAKGLQNALSPDDLQRRFEDAFRSYTRSLRDTWTEIPPEEMDVNALATLAYAAQVGVAMACQTASVVQQRALALAAMVPPQMRG